MRLDSAQKILLTFAIVAGLAAASMAQEKTASPAETPSSAQPAAPGANAVPAPAPAAATESPSTAKPEPARPAPEQAAKPQPATDNAAPVTTDRQDSGLLGPGWDAVSSFCAGHLQLGIGVATYTLRDNKGNGAFLGSIDDIEADRDMVVPLSVGWSFCRYASMEFRHEEYTARTYTDTADNHSDGVVVMKGWVPYLVGHLPLDVAAGWFSDTVPSWTKRVAPFAGVGYSLMSCSMDTEDWWALGYSSPADYEALGSPSTPRNGKTRRFSLQDNHAPVFMLGISGQISKRLSLDLLWTRANVDIDSTFYLYDDKQGDYVIPFHYDSFGLDLRYTF